MTQNAGGMYMYPLGSKRLIGGLGVTAGGAPSDPDISGLVEWFDFSDAATLFKDTARTVPVTAESDMIAGVADKANSNHLAQSTEASRPIYDLDVQNELSAAYFGTEERLLTSGSVSHNIGTGDFYMVAVNRYDGVRNLATLWSNGSYSPALYHQQNGTMRIYWGGYYNFTTVNTVGNHIIEFYRESGVVKLAVDGVLDATTLSISTSMGNAVTILGEDGAADLFGGHIFEFRLYSTLPSASERTALRAFLDYKWSP
jgi:hypothetical protein